jgi:dihydrofolate synthase/folylpolyglutamate synthase
MILSDLAARRSFGIRPGLDTITTICKRLGNPERRFKAIHIAGTNGKGAVAAILDSRLSGGRYTSPHLVRINERFFLNGQAVEDDLLEQVAGKVLPQLPQETTFFEALTAVAFELYGQAMPKHVVMETGLGGRLDATNVCNSELSVITKIGLDHCVYLGETIAEIAAEKAGIIKPGVPVVAGRNSEEALSIIERRAKELSAPFFYAPQMIDESALPDTFSLKGSFNRENAITALAAFKVLGIEPLGLENVVWPGRFQEVGRFIIDGAHNPPAAIALADALGGEKVDLIAGFCADKDVREVLQVLAPHVRRAFAVATNNPRSLPPQDTAKIMRELGMEARSCANGLSEALAQSDMSVRTLVCGSLFLAGEALVELNALPWTGPIRFDV